MKYDLIDIKQEFNEKWSPKSISKEDISEKMIDGKKEKSEEQRIMDEIYNIYSELNKDIRNLLKINTPEQFGGNINDFIIYFKTNIDSIIERHNILIKKLIEFPYFSIDFSTWKKNIFDELNYQLQNIIKIKQEFNKKWSPKSISKEISKHEKEFLFIAYDKGDPSVGEGSVSADIKIKFTTDDDLDNLTNEENIIKPLKDIVQNILYENMKVYTKAEWIEKQIKEEKEFKIK